MGEIYRVYNYLTSSWYLYDMYDISYVFLCSLLGMTITICVERYLNENNNCFESHKPLPVIPDVCLYLRRWFFGYLSGTFEITLFLRR